MSSVLGDNNNNDDGDDVNVCKFNRSSASPKVDSTHGPKAKRESLAVG